MSRSRETPFDVLRRLCVCAVDRALRVLIIAAHPDDETVGAGALLPRLLDCHIIHLTDGAPRDLRFVPKGVTWTRREYAAVRRREAEEALTLAGLPPDRIYSLGVADQELALEMVAATRWIIAVCLELCPDLLITHSYEGGHPDHDAAAFIARGAVELLRGRGQKPPELVEMTSYHGPSGLFVSGQFLPAAMPPAQTLTLTEEDRRRKRAMLSRYASQKDVLAVFGLAEERFRPAPRYDFTSPPHDGMLYYEALGWPMTGARFRELTRRALRDLRLVCGCD